MTFDRVAPFYDLLARLAFGQSLRRAQLWGIDHIRPGSRVLVLGGGTGGTLAHLLARQPSYVLYVEASAVMLKMAKQRTQPHAPVAFVLGTERDVPAMELFEYILLPFVLDVHLIDTLTTHMLPRLLAHLPAGGQLIVTDFDRPQRYWQRAYMWVMLRFFRLTAGIPVKTWTNWPQTLWQAGLVEQDVCLFRAGQVRSGCWVRA
ncbi:methyltransferase domain-containing protein [Fibrella arboris]|uniref:methyltransferase domain-containing protein n=1 Tax=Fibrella arboris TaxID=3242486 RepID=UPI00351FDE84